VPHDFASTERLAVPASGDGLFTRGAFAALVWDGVFSQALGSLTGGALLVGCALALGASPAYVGVLSAIPFFAQLAYVPAIILVERVRQRKSICVAVTFLARLMLVPLAVVPLLSDRGLALMVLLLCFALVGPLGAIGGCAWMSWTCDLVPRERLGAVFSRRQLAANLSGILAALAGAAVVEGWAAARPHLPLGGYVGVFSLAIVAAMGSTWFLTRMPDVPMPPKPPGDLRALFARPFRNANFRRVMIFLGCWSFASNMAMPFFTVYLMQDLGCGIAVPAALAIAGQLANLASLPAWGKLSDRFSNKRVIAMAAPLLLVAVLGWVLAAEPAPHMLTLPLIVMAQLMLGAASGGLDLACGNIALKTAPKGEATVYLGTNGLFKSLCGGVGPVAGGWLARSFAGASCSLTVPWQGHAITLFTLKPLAVVFLVACLAGLLALTRLPGIAEPGETILGLPVLCDLRLRAKAARAAGASLANAGWAGRGRARKTRIT